MISTRSDNKNKTKRTKDKKMKILNALLTITALLALATGCSTPGKENMLSAAGFKMVPADTAQQQQQLNTLPADKISAAQRDGTVYYTFPDPKKKVLYVGGESEYQKYKQL